MNTKDKKASSTSTIFVNGLINNPNIKQVIKAVSTLIYSIILEDIKENKTISQDSDFYLFSEEKYISENPALFQNEKILHYRKTPIQEDVYNFLEVLFIYKF